MGGSKYEWIDFIIGDSKAREVESGAIELIAGAMKAHSDNVNVCTNGCNAIWKLVHDGN